MSNCCKRKPKVYKINTVIVLFFTYKIKLENAGVLSKSQQRVECNE